MTKVLAVSIAGTFVYEHAVMTMNYTARTAVIGFVGFIVAGCASKTDLYMLQDDVRELKSQSQKSGGQTAEVYSEVEKLRDEVAMLQGTIEELRFKLAESERQTAPDMKEELFPPDTTAVSPALDKVAFPEESQPEAETAQPAADQALQVEPPVVPAIDDQGLYDAGVRFFESYNYPSARKEFELLLDNYPSSPFADDAQYYIAETHYNEKWFEKAILEYQLVIEKYPEGNRSPSAYFKQGLSFENIGDSTNAKVRYRELVQLYPDSDEAKIVGPKLQ